MKKIINSAISILFFTFALCPQLQATFTASNYAEVITACARGPLAAWSYKNHTNYSKSAKIIHGAVNLARLTNEVLSVLNHPDDLQQVSYFWVTFDAANILIDLIAQYPDDSSQTTELSSSQTDQLAHLVQRAEKYFFPAIEGVTALLRAINTEVTPQACLERRRMRALCSLSRALSIFSNHPKSIPAIALLFGAIGEIMLTLQAQDALYKDQLSQLQENHMQERVLLNEQLRLQQEQTTLIEQQQQQMEQNQLQERVQLNEQLRLQQEQTAFVAQQRQQLEQNQLQERAQFNEQLRQMEEQMRLIEQLSQERKNELDRLNAIFDELEAEIESWEKN